jgi:hypothetical protein
MCDRGLKAEGGGLSVVLTARGHAEAWNVTFGLLLGVVLTLSAVTGAGVFVVLSGALQDVGPMALIAVHAYSGLVGLPLLPVESTRSTRPPTVVASTAFGTTLPSPVRVPPCTAPFAPHSRCCSGCSPCCASFLPTCG